MSKLKRSKPPAKKQKTQEIWSCVVDWRDKINPRTSSEIPYKAFKLKQYTMLLKKNN